MALFNPLTVRAVPHFANIEEYYASVPTCGVQCERDYWGVRVNSPTCGGDGTKFLCFCDNAVLASTDLIFTLGDARRACFKSSCPESEFNNIDLAQVRIAAYCSELRHPGGYSIASLVCLKGR